MNFLDTYDIARSATPNPEQAQDQPSLNEEVTQVIGQLGRFWGGFRKQSQQVLEVARKDLGDVVVQAQKELSKLTVAPETTPEPTTSHEPIGGDDPDTTVESSNKEEGISGTTSSPLAESSSTPRGHTSNESWSGTTQAFFSRLQSSLPPNIVATVQNNIPESIKHASENLDFTQMRTNLLSDLQRVQGVTKAQAEEYYHKSEVMFKDAMTEAGDILRDAVKVVPPEEAAASGAGSFGAGMLWDGTDMWMLPYENPGSESSDASGSSTKAAGKGKEIQTAAAVATRAEALLKRLKQDPSILKHDPEAESVSKDAFISWRDKEVQTKEGGIENADWSTKITSVLEDGPDGQALKQLEETLVPAEMTRAAFWQRYFFRSHQIRTEEEKRKALILSTSETDEDFSWEDEEEEEDEEEDDDEDDDDEDSSSTTTSNSTDTSPPAAPEVKGKIVSPPSVSPTVALLRADDSSRRVSSEDSFDLVSTASASASVSGDAEKPLKPKPTDDEDDDDDDDEDGESDWE